jgi:protein FrlC
MKLACNTWMYSSFPAWLPAYPLDYAIERLAAIGYDGIEIGCASPVAYPPYVGAEERKKLAGLLKKHNIAVSSVLPCPGGGMGNNVSSPIKEERVQSVKSYKECIQLGADLGAKICLYVAGWQIWGVEHAQAFEWSRECLKEVAQFANGLGVTVAVEPTSMDSNVIETADDALALMHAVNMPNVKVMFDTIHVLYRKEIITDYIERMGRDLVHIHVSDLDRMPPGYATDFRLMVDALKKIDYKGYLAMEIGLGGRGVDPNAFARKAFEYMKPLL